MPMSMASRPKVVAYLGPRASFTHQAALTAFPPSQELTHDPLPTIPSIFAAIQSKTARYGVVPFYNTTHGAVTTTLDSFLMGLRPCPGDSQTKCDLGTSKAGSHNATVRIIGEIIVPIQHNLLGFPGANGSFEHVKKVFSHEQALGQCAKFLSQHLPDAEQVSVNSTSRAAEMVAAAKSEAGEVADMAAISSAMAAKEYSVPILQPSIQDRNDNTTRFFILEIVHAVEKEAVFPLKEKNLILFTVSHALPGALFRALETLFKHRLNMTGIHQRPPNEERDEDAIFVEVGGVLGEEVLDDLKQVTEMAVRLGSW